MATTYAALVSLLNVLNRLQRPSCPAIFDSSQMQSLLDKASWLVDFLESHCKSISKDFERKVSDAAYAAQDRLDSYVVFKIHERRARTIADRIRLRFFRESYAKMHQDLHKAIQGIDLIISEAMEVKQEKGEKNQPPGRSNVQVGSSVRVVPYSETIQILGFEEELNKLLERLASNRSSREVIPVVGMGGIGKSTLATSVYNRPYVRDNFVVKAWVTISQVYNTGTIIRPLLNDLGVPAEAGDADLGDLLYKYLFGRKYLIILDDIWDIQAWEGISRFLPDNGNGSRVLLTTRLMNVARSVGLRNLYEMQLLDAHKSWDLLSKKVFGQGACPSELEICGRRIAKSCKGLPLALVVIGGILKLSNNTLDYWEDVAQNISSVMSQGDEDNYLKILSLSYHELPIHLRPCFLYLATFPEDQEIRVSELTMLWAADGFIKPNADDTLEELALENLKELISRNLLMVRKRDSIGHMKCLIIHDLVRDLCIREAQMERFLYVCNGVGAIESQRRFVLQRFGRFMLPTIQQTRLVRSLISFADWAALPDMPLLSLLQVFLLPNQGTPPEDIWKNPMTPFGVKDIMQLANLRFVKSSYHPWLFDRTTSLISSISFLWNLETIIVDVPRDDQRYSLPCEIWELQHIKHLVLSTQVVFPDPPSTHTDFVLSNLQTLKKVELMSNKVLYRIPNIKDLSIACFKEELPPCFWNLFHGYKLEKLFYNGGISFHSDELNTVKLFPNCLKKLTLCWCAIPWSRMTIIGSLPNLEVLNLKDHAFVGKEWKSTEGEFQSLKILSIQSNWLAVWRVEDSAHFPCLEHLSLREMNNLEEVPLVFGESMTLKSIQLVNGNASVVISAKQILEEHESLGNDDLRVNVVFLYPLDGEQKTEMCSLVSDRFHVKLHPLQDYSDWSTEEFTPLLECFMSTT